MKEKEPLIDFEIRKKIAEQIKYYREKNKWSMAELADKVNTGKGNVSSWESMKYAPGLAAMARLCKVFNITISDLYGEQEQKIKQNETQPLLEEFFKKLNISEEHIEKLSDEQIHIIKGTIKNFLDNQRNK